jgi:rSAM/selenodomain-associated transferase 1
MTKKIIHQGHKQRPRGLAIKDCIVLFVKAPQKGQVKTRLSQVIGEKVTLDLYKAFVADIIETLQREPQYSTRIAFYPQEARGKVVRWLGKQHTFLPQRGSGLGERMANTFEQVFSEGFKKALVIGSDIPDLPRSIITNALESLSTRDAVIGPSFDGGYYLIGFRHDTFFPAVFESIEWGTDAVLFQTLKRFEKTHIVQILPLWRDIDNLLDIKGLLERNTNTFFENSRTISVIKSTPKILKYFR